MAAPGEKHLDYGSDGGAPRQVWSDSGPAQGWSQPPPAYSETYPHQAGAGIPGHVGAGVTNVVHVVHPVIFGEMPVQTVCPHCNNQVQ